MIESEFGSTNTNVVVFEDDFFTTNEIRQTLHGTNINIAAEASSLNGAFDVLKEILSGSMLADVILLDGNLAPGRERAVFDYTLPVSEAEVARKGLFGRTKAARAERVVVDGAHFSELGGDAKAILEVIKRVRISSKIIGISSNRLSDYDITVDTDLTKNNLNELVAVINGLNQ